MGEPFCFRKFLAWKKLWIRRGDHNFRANFFLTVPKNFVGGTLVFQKCFGIKKFLDNRGITILSIFFVSQCQKILWETLQCFRKFGVSKNFMHKGGITILRRKILCLIIPKKLCRGPFSVRQNFGFRKNFCMRGISRFSVRSGGGGGVARFSVDYFMSHSTETFVGEPFSASLISGIEKFYASEGYVTIFDFLKKFFVSQYRKISKGNPSVFQKISGIEKFYG